MKNYLIFFIFLLTTSVFTQTPVEKFSEEIKSIIQNEIEEHLVWIYFTDKGTDVENYLINPEKVISKQSVVRREKVLAKKNIIDFSDIPVNQNYLNEIISSGFRVKHKSKWFNAVSGYATSDELKKISELSFVRNIDVVRKFKDKRIDIDETKINTVNKTNLQPEGVHTYNYGLSYTQSAISNIPQVHDLGYKASGITICLMDAGFANLSHEVFQNMNIIAMYDFVEGLTTMVGHQHGTATLSLIGGLKEGQLIGPAFGANFILARTENDPGSETPQEEDNWIAAMEWADSIGVDVTSTSLGYLTFDPPYNSYTWQDMDGNTAIITKGADIAASKGIVVVNSAGNSGYDPNHNTLGAPADGDSVITVGSVDAFGSRANYSSVGPTVDGRIKPDLMAMGMGPYIALTSSTTAYTISATGGTSYACPIVAGVAALLLSVNPSLTPMEIRDILRQTASNSSNPDNLIGWGIVDALAAVNLVLTDIKEETVPDNFLILSNYPNPFNPSTIIRYSVPEDGVTKIKLYNVLGKEVMTLLDEAVSKGTHELTLDGKNLTSGVYFLSLISGNNLKTIKISLIK
jgi:subtilisin family serine protease